MLMILASVVGYITLIFMFLSFLSGRNSDSRVEESRRRLEALRNYSTVAPNRRMASESVGEEIAFRNKEEVVVEEVSLW